MDATIQSYLRSVVTAGSRDTEQIGPFLAGFDRDSDHPYLSYAIPDDGAEPSADDVAALREAFVRRARVARLEFLPAVAPAAEAALAAGGFAVEGVLPLMTAAPGDSPDLEPPEDIELLLPTSDEDLQAGGAVASAAFGDPSTPGPSVGTRSSIWRASGLPSIVGTCGRTTVAYVRPPPSAIKPAMARSAIP